jgi:WD40 repeat protein
VLDSHDHKKTRPRHVTGTVEPERSENDDSNQDRADAPPTEAGRLDAFISYSRRSGGIEFADHLVFGLEERGKTVWIDRENIEAAAAWRERIHKGIEAAKSLIYVISPESVRSRECDSELAIALEAHKRIIPVVFKDVAPEELPDSIAALNWIFARSTDIWSAALEGIVEALDTDLEWRDLHTRLGVRASEWISSGRDASYLLRGSDLRQAEEWHAEGASHAEEPTSAQKEYIDASRAAAARRQRRLLSGVALALVVSIVLSIVAVIKSIQATNEAHASQSIAMAAEATNLLSSNTSIGMMLSILARERDDTPQANNALAAALSSPLEIGPQFKSAVNVIIYTKALIASALENGKVELYRVAGSHSTQVALSFDSPVAALAVSPDSKMLAVGLANGTVDIENLASSSSMSLKVGSPVTAVAFNRQGSAVAIGNSDGTLTTDVLASGTIRTVKSLGYLTGVAFSPNGKTIAYSSYLGLGQYTIETNSTHLLNQEDVNTVALSPDGSEIASGDENGKIEIENLTTGTTTRFNAGASVSSVAFSPNGQFLGIGDISGTMIVLDVSTGRVMASIDYDDPIDSVTFDPSGDLLVGGDLYGVEPVMNWDGGAVETLNDDSIVESLSYSKNGQFLASGDGDGTVNIRDFKTGTLQYLNFQGGIEQVDFSPNGKDIAVLSSLGEVTLLNFKGAGSDTTLPETHITSIAYLAEDQLALGSAAGRVVDVNLRTLGSRTVLTIGHAVTSIAASSDGKTIAVASKPDTITVRALALDRSSILRTIGTVYHLAFSDSGTLLAYGDNVGHIVVRSMVTGDDTDINDGQSVSGIAFSPNGAELATSTLGGQIYFYTLATHSTVTLDANSLIQSIAYSPNGSTLAGGGDDGQIVVYRSSIWHSTLAQAKKQICNSLGSASLTKSEWQTYVPDQKYSFVCP